MSVEELDGSELGTKEYWDENYVRELKNYKRAGDVGEIWFDEDAQARIVDWICQREQLISKNAKILDVGCGNGMFLVELAGENYKNLLGIDYSQTAVDLANNIAKDRELNIQYDVADLMDTDACRQKFGQFDVIHDKGTYDAISLCPENTKEKRLLYIDTIASLMHADSLFIITSCNWTVSELVLSFTHKFVRFEHIPTPSFKFGGVEGNVITSVVFKLK